jgi:hypothetical protein
MPFILALYLATSPVLAQEGNFDLFQGATMPLEFGLGEDLMVRGPEPRVMAGCLMREDGLTPVLCKGGEYRTPPEGIVWKEDPEARVGAPRHCLWWEEGEKFLGVGDNRICREGALSAQRDYSVVTPLEGEERETEAQRIQPGTGGLNDF